jgi:hypothetical protein
VLFIDKYATGGRATPSRIFFLLQKQNNRSVAAAAVASYRPPANASSLAGTLRYATPAGACYSTPPPPRKMNRGGTLLRVRYAHSSNAKELGLRLENE